MAIFNEILSGRFNRALQKIFAIKGSPPVRQLGGEILPVHGIFSGVENRFLESWNRFAADGLVTAVAAVTSASMFRNPVTSNVIAVIERLSFSESVADPSLFVSQDTGTAALSTAVGQRCLDNRAVKGSTSTLGAACQVTQQTGFVVTGGIIFRIGLPALADYNLIVNENQEITVLPGDVIEVVTSNVNVNLTTNWMWRERVLEESERQ